jgi:hypothetical protein
MPKPLPYTSGRQAAYFPGGNRTREEPRDTPPGALVFPHTGSIHRSPLRNLIPRSKPTRVQRSNAS